MEGGAAVNALRRRLGAALLLVAAGGAFASASGACELLLHEPRSGRELARLPMNAPRFEIAFTHSVLKTAVVDRYAWRRGAWHLVEERFEGQGYGLPAAADANAGERLETAGAVTRLIADRRVDPLVVRAVPEAAMRLRIEGQPELAMTPLTRSGIAFTRSPACERGAG